MGSNSAVILFIALAGAALYKYIIYPCFLSPLAKIPNAHWSCSFSPIWLYYVRWTKQENRSIYKRHMESGAAIRLSPTTVSINSFEDGLKKIYQGGFPKPRFYFNGFAIYKTENLVTFEDNAPHSARKRLVANIYSKSSVMSSMTARAATRDVLLGRLMPLITKNASENCPLEVLDLMYAYSMDSFIQWQFGRTLGSNLIEDEKERRMYLDSFFAPSGYFFWQYYFPNLVNYLRHIGIYLIPKWVDQAFSVIEDWNLDKCDKAQQLLAQKADLDVEDVPVVFKQALKGMSTQDSKPKEYPGRMKIASEMFAHNSAAFETSGTTLGYAMWELCRRPKWQTRLREELLTLRPQLIFQEKQKYQIEDLPDPKDVDNLPVLHAILLETLRLYPSVPGGQPRVVPRSCSLGGFDDIPIGTTVQCAAYSLHLTPSVFPDPYEWRPERWLDASAEELVTMRHWFWAFGSGARMCIGSNFAFFSMKMALAAIYSSMTTTIQSHGDLELGDGYMAGPKEKRLELNFHRIIG